LTKQTIFDIVSASLTDFFLPKEVVDGGRPLSSPPKMQGCCLRILLLLSFQRQIFLKVL